MNSTGAIAATGVGFSFENDILTDEVEKPGRGEKTQDQNDDSDEVSEGAHCDIVVIQNWQITTRVTWRILIGG